MYRFQNHIIFGLCKYSRCVCYFIVACSLCSGRTFFTIYPHLFSCSFVAAKFFIFINIRLLLVFISRHDIFRFSFFLRIYYEIVLLFFLTFFWFFEKSKQFSMWPFDWIRIVRVYKTHGTRYSWTLKCLVATLKYCRNKLMDLNNCLFWTPAPFIRFFFQATNCFFITIKLKCMAFHQIRKLCIIFGCFMYKYQIINNVLKQKHVFKTLNGGWGVIQEIESDMLSTVKIK